MKNTSIINKTDSNFRPRRLRKGGGYVKTEVLLEPLTKELIHLMAASQGLSLSRYLASAAFEKLARDSQPRGSHG